MRRNPSLVTALWLLALMLCAVTPAHAQRPSIANLQAQIDQQAGQITALQANDVPGLASYLSVDTSMPGQPALTITAANLKVVNGEGATSSANGLGNVIVGYDEVRPFGSEVCSLGEYVDVTNCEANGGTWAISHKSGSHNLVIGAYHNYSRFGGLVAGAFNTVNGAYATVSGGQANSATSTAASVSGGNANVASGQVAHVSGGDHNTASGEQATVSGGYNNTASGYGAHAGGGEYNTASGEYATVSGGSDNTVQADHASVSGGFLCDSAGTSFSWTVGSSDNIGGCSTTLHN